MLSITTDFIQSNGDPSPHLRLIRETGFSYIHWCHEWNTDHYYGKEEIDTIQIWLNNLNLRLNDLHSTQGVEKYWISTQGERQTAGIDLVKNRINMAARLGSDVIIQHVAAEPTEKDENLIFWDRLRRSLDQIENFARGRGVKLAFENLTSNLTTLIKVLNNYPPDFVGLCFDSGHANITAGTLEMLEPHKDRLISIHLHDNNGLSDQHKVPFTGTVDWDKVIRFIAESSYQKCVNLEVGIHESEFHEESVFLGIAKASGEKLRSLINQYRDSQEITSEI